MNISSSVPRRLSPTKINKLYRYLAPKAAEND